MFLLTGEDPLKSSVPIGRDTVCGSDGVGVRFRSKVPIEFILDLGSGICEVSFRVNVQG